MQESDSDEGPPAKRFRASAGDGDDGSRVAVGDDVGMGIDLEALRVDCIEYRSGYSNGRLAPATGATSPASAHPPSGPPDPSIAVARDGPIHPRRAARTYSEFADEEWEEEEDGEEEETLRPMEDTLRTSDIKKAMLEDGSLVKLLTVGGTIRLSELGGNDCWADGCGNKALTTRWRGHLLHGMCEVHSRELEVSIGGEMVRACNACNAVHPLGAFDTKALRCTVRKERAKEYKTARSEEAAGIAAGHAAAAAARKAAAAAPVVPGAKRIRKETWWIKSGAYETTVPADPGPHNWYTKRPSAGYLALHHDLTRFSSMLQGGRIGFSVDGWNWKLCDEGCDKVAFATHPHGDHYAYFTSDKHIARQLDDGTILIMPAVFKRLLQHMALLDGGTRILPKMGAKKNRPGLHKRLNLGLVRALELGVACRVTGKDGKALPVFEEYDLRGPLTAALPQDPEGLWVVAVDANHSLGDGFFICARFFEGVVLMEWRSGDVNVNATVLADLEYYSDALERLLTQSGAKVEPSLRVVDATQMDGPIAAWNSSEAALAGMVAHGKSVEKAHGPGATQYWLNGYEICNRPVCIEPFMREVTGMDKFWTARGPFQALVDPETGSPDVHAWLGPVLMARYTPHLKDAHVVYSTDGTLDSAKNGEAQMKVVAHPDYRCCPASVTHFEFMQATAFFRIQKKRHLAATREGGRSVSFVPTRISDHSPPIGIAQLVAFLLRRGVPKDKILTLQRNFQPDFNVMFLGMTAEDSMDVYQDGGQHLTIQGAIELAATSILREGAAITVTVTGARKNRAPWGPEEVRALLDGVRKFPKGCYGRWAKIRGTRLDLWDPPAGSTAIARTAQHLGGKWRYMLKSGDPECVEIDAELKAAAPVETTAAAGGASRHKFDRWAPEEVRALLDGVRKFPKGCYGRWIKVRGTRLDLWDPPPGSTAVARTSKELGRKWCAMLKSGDPECVEIDAELEDAVAASPSAAALAPPALQGLTLEMVNDAIALQNRRLSVQGGTGLPPPPQSALPRGLSAQGGTGLPPLPPRALQRGPSVQDAVGLSPLLLPALQRVQGVVGLPLSPPPALPPLWGYYIPIIPKTGFNLRGLKIPGALPQESWVPRVHPLPFYGVPPPGFHHAPTLPPPPGTFYVPFCGRGPSGPVPPGAIMMPPWFWKPMPMPPLGFMPTDAAATAASADAGAAPAPAAPAPSMGS